MIAVILVIVSSIVGSPFLHDFIQEDLTALLLTLLAINTATSSVISSKIEDLSQRYDYKFINSHRSMKHALIEQIVLIVIAVLVLIISNGKMLCKWPYVRFVSDVVLTTVLVYSIEILRDTGVAMFNIVINLHSDDQEEG